MQRLFNISALTNGEGQTNILVQLNGTGSFTYYWNATNASTGVSRRYPSSGNATGPTVTSPFIASSEAYSPLYGNPNQNYTFNITLNSTAGVAVTPTVWIVNGSGNVVYNETGSPITDSGGTAYGTSTATVNITQTGSWSYFWNTSINGVSVRYPESGYLTGPEADYYYIYDFNAPANLSKLTASVTWNSLNESNSLSIRLADPNGNLINQFNSSASTRTKVTRTVVIPLPLIDYNVTRYVGLNRMSITSPASGAWQLHVINSEISQFEADVEFS